MPFYDIGEEGENGDVLVAQSMDLGFLHFPKFPSLRE